MAVGFGVTGIGAGDSSNNSLFGIDTHVAAGFDLVVNAGDCIIAGLSFSAADLALGPFIVGDNELDDLARKVTCGSVQMTSLGVIQWDTLQAWTEVFALLDAPGGKQRIIGAVGGGVASKRLLRVSAATYSGVDSVGTPVIVSGTGTSMSISATVTAADRVVGVFGTRSGISAFNGSIRYLNNAGISLLIGDAAGTGSSQSLTGTRQKSGQWGGIVVPLNAADTVASCPPMAFGVGFGELDVQREQRLGGLRRQVFVVPLDSDGKKRYIDTADPKSPDDVTPLTLDWTNFLALTKDRIRDGWIDIGTRLEKRDDWFTFTDQTVMVAGGSAGRPEYITFHIDTWGGESYSRTLKLPIKSL
jgi:hypothetical protein